MSFNKQALRGGALSYGSFLISKMLLYASTLVLARVLAPRDFGLVGYALVAISFLDVVKDLGVTQALIYRQDIRDDDAGEAFVLSVASGLAFFGLCWMLAPLTANFFHDPRVPALTRMLGFSFIFSGLGGVHAALLQKRLRFGRRFLPDLLQSLIKGVVSVALALHGVGYWSLVWGQLAGIAAATLASWYLLPWRPRLKMHWNSSRPLLGFGLHVTVINILGIVIYNGDYMIVGRMLGSTPLGLYTMAYIIPQMLTINLSVALSRVLFPAYAAIQGDYGRLRQGYLTVLRYNALILIPMGLGLCAAAPAFVHTLYRSSWWPAIPVMQTLALYATLYAIGWNTFDVYRAIGRPDVQWKLSIPHMLVLLPALLTGAKVGGITGVAVAQLVVAIPYTLVRFWLIGRTLSIGVAAISTALRIPVVAGACLFGTCMAVTLLPGAKLAPPVALAIQVILGTIAYAATVLLLDKEIRTRILKLSVDRLAGRGRNRTRHTTIAMQSRSSSLPDPP